MAYTQTDIDQLKAILARGVLRGKINGEEVEFAGFAELRAVIRAAETEVAGMSGGGMIVTYPTTSRGL